MKYMMYHSHMDAVRASRLDDEPDAFWRDDGEVYVHAGTRYHLCGHTYKHTLSDKLTNDPPNSTIFFLLF